MNSTNIQFTIEFMQTMSTKRQMSPPCRSAWLPSNCLAQAQGGQAASQHASPAALPVESPRTIVVFSSSTRITRSSSKAIATTLLKDVPHLPDSAGASNKEFVPDSAEANSMFGVLKLIPELPGTSEMPTASITILHGTVATSVQGSTCRTNAEARNNHWPSLRSRVLRSMLAVLQLENFPQSKILNVIGLQLVINKHSTTVYHKKFERNQEKYHSVDRSHSKSWFGMWGSFGCKVCQWHRNGNAGY